MIKPPSTLSAHLQDEWIQATEAAYMEGVVATLARLHKQLGCNCDLSVNVDAEFFATCSKGDSPSPSPLPALPALPAAQL